MLIINVLDIFLTLFSVFLRKKVTVNKNISFTDYASTICLSDHSELAIHQKTKNDVTIFWHCIIVRFSWRCFVSFVKFNYWSKFPLNIITRSGVMTIYFYKGLTRNPEITDTPVWILPNIWRMGRVPVPNSDGLNKMLLNAAKCQGYSFYCFWVIKGKPTGGKKLPLAQIRVNYWLGLSF